MAVLGERRGAHGPGFYSGLPNQAVAFSPDGTQVASITQSFNGAMLWDAKTLRPLAAFGGPTGHFSSLAYAPDGKTLGIASGGVQWWNVSGAKPVLERTVNQGVFSHCDFDPAARRVAVSGGHEITLWDLARADSPPLARWTQPNEIGIVALKFFPSGRLLASVGERGPLFLWDLTADPPALVGQYDSQDGKGTAALAISPDGKTLASCVSEKSVRLWDVRRSGLKRRADLPRAKAPTAWRSRRGAQA